MAAAAPRILCVAGARPNFMKIKPVLDALEAEGAATVLVHTGQHYDAAMSDVFFEELGIRAPDHHLGIGSGSHAVQTAKVMEAFEPLVESVAPDVVVVVGDVNSTMACALVAAKMPPEVAHVEAGLRSRDWSMPEEVNRVVTDRVADYLLAPSQDGVDNLLTEGVEPDRVHLVGNVMVYTLVSNLDRARQRPVLDELGLDGRCGLVTLHRPANVDEPRCSPGSSRRWARSQPTCPSGSRFTREPDSGSTPPTNPYRPECPEAPPQPVGRSRRRTHRDGPAPPNLRR